MRHQVLAGVLCCLGLGCGPAGLSGPKLELLFEVHKGDFLAIADGGDVIYALALGALHVIEKGKDGAVVTQVPLPMGPRTGTNGALLLRGDTLFGVLPSSSFALSVADRRAPRITYEDRTTGGSTLALDGTTLFVAQGQAVARYDVSNPADWKLLMPSMKSDLQGDVATPFVGPDSMVLDAARGLVVLAGRDTLEVRRASDLTRVRQANGTDAFPLPVWSLLGLFDRAIVLCNPDQGLMSLPLADDGTLGSATALKTEPCAGRLVGGTAWLGINKAPVGLNRFTTFELSTKAQRTLAFQELTPTDVEDARQRAIYSVFRGAIVNDDLVYLDVGDLLVVGPK